MTTRAIVALAVTVAWILAGAGCARKSDDRQRAELAKALKGTKVTLEEGLMVSERVGMPISAAFEVEDGALQLSVFTIKGDAFSEVTVDPKTGYIVEFEPVAGEDLADARAQSEAMVMAKVSLRAVTERAVKANPGFRAVSVIPILKNGRPVAAITLIKDEEFKTVSEDLD